MGRVVWNRSTWVKHPVSGRRALRMRPESEWVVTPCPAVIDEETWATAQQRLKERATGKRLGRPRRYLLSGLLVCERCGARLVVTSKPARYACGTYLHGGRAACPVDATARRDGALPAEGAYRAAVSDINRALQGKNVEAARAALRSFLGDIPVFQTGRQLAARLTMNAGALLRNPGNVLLVGSGGRI